jgi:hypothetical protein
LTDQQLPGRLDFRCRQSLFPRATCIPAFARP